MLTEYQKFQQKHSGKGWSSTKMGQEWRKIKGNRAQSAGSQGVRTKSTTTPKKADKNTCNAPEKVLDKSLYCETKANVKRKISVWPSAYGSMLLVKEYKKSGGRYKGPRRVSYEQSSKSKKGWGDSSSSSPSQSGGVTRWLEEEWVNVCKKKKDGNYAKCGRSKAKDDKDYPYCRPLHRITKDTPMTVDELTKKYGNSKLDEMCKKKQQEGKPKKGKPSRIRP